MKVFGLVASIFIGLICCKAAQIGTKKLTPLRVVSTSNHVTEERIVCTAVLIKPRILLASGKCIYENLQKYGHDFAFVYDDQFFQITIDENNLLFNEGFTRYFNESLRNFGLIFNNKQILSSEFSKYFYEFASDVNNINFTDCIVQTPSGFSTLDEAYSCASSNDVDKITYMANNNSIHCPKIVNLWRDDDMLICSLKDKPNDMVLVGFKEHGSDNFVNLADLDTILSPKLKEGQIVKSQNNDISSFQSAINAFNFFYTSTSYI